jgi:catechol 2,3-dioxygenase-like lactoylglutathione lyase family enzyme
LAARYTGGTEEFREQNSICSQKRGGSRMKKAPEKAKMILYAYTVEDYEKTAAWYREALGVEFPSDCFTVPRLDVAKGALSDGSAMVELLQMDEWRGVEPGYASGHIGFQVQDIEAMRAHLQGLGIEPSEVIYPFEGNDKVRICYFRGPNNEKLELVQMDE